MKKKSHILVWEFTRMFEEWNYNAESPRKANKDCTTPIKVRGNGRKH